MTELKNDRFLRALLREPVDRTPIWIMRQAGRYLPEYRATRAKAGSFMNLCTNPELACEVTLQPLARFDLDAAILFSDILTIPDAMGLGLSFAQGEGPQFARPVRSAADVEKLGVPDPEGELRYVMDAVRVIRRELDGRVPLIGFSGSPWTLATYMVEGSGSKEYAHVKGMLFDRPDLLHKLLDTTARAVTSYLNAQIAAGAQAVMVFDTWGGVLSPRDYIDFSLRYMAQIVDGLTREHEGRRVPVILFTKGGGAWLESMTETGCDALGVDWTTDIGAARKRVGDRVALQGNMDPCVLYASPERIRAEAATILKSYGAGPGHVFNLGHGIHQHVNPGGVKVIGVRDPAAKPNQIKHFHDRERYEVREQSIESIDFPFDVAFSAWMPAGRNYTPDIVKHRPKLIVFIHTKHVNEETGAPQTGTPEAFTDLPPGYLLIHEWGMTRPKDVLHEVWPDLTPSIEETRYVKVYADEGYHHIDVPDEVAPAQPYDWEFELDMALLALQAKQHLQAQGAQVPPY